MNPTRLDPDASLEASLRRIRGALAQNRNQYAAMVGQIMAAADAEVAERVSARIAERQQRRMNRGERREQQRMRRLRHDPSDLPRGIVSGAVAAVCLVLAVIHPAMWWLVFVALGLGTSAASAFGRAARSRRAGREGQGDDKEETTAAEPARAEAGGSEPPARTEPADPRVTRIQSLCDKLLAELESGPPIVREVVTEPQATIGGLRQACLETARRERELRTVLAAQEEGTLVAERDALVTRISNERDEIVRDRLGQALRALEQQLAHRAELTTAATRLEAENTRILYTLESLHMQLLRARSTDIGAPELGGKLRESLRDLGAQIDAVAEALEWASATKPGGEGERPATADPGPSAADLERAERHEAARRAAQARESERR